MPILKYFAIVGSVLVALLFVADATLDKRGPMPFNNEFSGMPKKWTAEAPTSMVNVIETPAPAPDMNSAAVRAAAPPPLTAAAAEARAEAPPQQVAKVEAPKKPKPIVRKPYDSRQNYAWQHNTGPFGGGFFGRF